MEWQQAAKARAAVAAGASHRQVAARYGVHHKTVQRWLILTDCPRCLNAMDYRAALCRSCFEAELDLAWDTRAKEIEVWYGRDELPWSDLVLRLHLTPGYVRQLLHRLRLQGYNVPTRFKRHNGREVATNVLA